MGPRDFTDFKLMPQSEVDAEMEMYFRERQEAEMREARERAQADRAADAMPRIAVNHPRQISCSESEGLARAKRIMSEYLYGPKSDGAKGSLVSPGSDDVIAAVPTPARDLDDSSERLDPSFVEHKPSGEEETLDPKKFPIGSLSMLPAVINPLRELEGLRNRLALGCDYSLVRRRYCELSIFMNLMGQIAPAFRPRMSGNGRKSDPNSMIMHRDRLVIDYHWCHASKMNVTPRDAMHAAILDFEREFSFDAAWELSGKKWTKGYRAAEALSLTRMQQCQTMTIHGPELTEVLKGIDSGWRESGGKTTSKLAMAKREIAQWAELDRRIQPEREKYELLWRVREMLGRSAPAQLTAELYALATGGSVLDRASVRDRLKRLDKHVSA